MQLKEIHLQIYNVEQIGTPLKFIVYYFKAYFLIFYKLYYVMRSVNLFSREIFAKKISVQRIARSAFYIIGKDDFPII